MGHLKREACEHFKLVSRVLFMLFLFPAALAFIFGMQVGYATAAWICLGFGLIITIVYGALFVVNFLYAWFMNEPKRIRHSKGAP